MYNEVICVAEVVNTANTSDIFGDLKDTTKHKKDKELLFVFKELDDVPEGGKSKKDDCDDAER